MPGVLKLLPPYRVILKVAFGLSRVMAVWPLVANMRWVSFFLSTSRLEKRFCVEFINVGSGMICPMKDFRS